MEDTLDLPITTEVITLNYNGEFGKHRLNALVGYTLQKKTYDRVAVEATGFPDDRIHEVTAHGPNASDIGLYSSDTRKAAWTMMSYLARVNYSFDNRYVVTGTVRTHVLEKKTVWVVFLLFL